MGLMPPSAPPEQQADAATRQIIETLGDGGCTKFRTSLFASGIEKVAFWLTASKQPGTQKWNVTRYDRFDGGEGGESLYPQTRLKENLCFFDALHYCALTQHQQAEKNATLQDDTNYIHAAFPTIAQAADQADIPLDNDYGLPFPAVDGIIIGEGSFSARAHDVAARTAGRFPADVEKQEGKLVPFSPDSPEQADEWRAARARLFAALEEERAPYDLAVATESENLRLAQEQFKKRKQELLGPFEAKKNEAASFDDAVSRAENVAAGIRHAMDNSFGHPSLRRKANLTTISGLGLSAFGAAGLVCGTLIDPVFLMWLGVGGPGSAWFLREGLKNTSREASSQYRHQLDWAQSWEFTIPDCPEKQAFLDFNKAAKAVYALEEAAFFHEKKGAGNRKGRKILEAALPDSGFSEANCRALKESYNTKSFPKPGSFLGALEAQIENLKIAADRAAVALLKKPVEKPALPAPA